MKKNLKVEATENNNRQNKNIPFRKLVLNSSEKGTKSIYCSVKHSLTTPDAFPFPTPLHLLILAHYIFSRPKHNSKHFGDAPTHRVISISSIWTFDKRNLSGVEWFPHYSKGETKKKRRLVLNAITVNQRCSRAKLFLD